MEAGSEGFSVRFLLDGGSDSGVGSGSRAWRLGGQMKEESSESSMSSASHGSIVLRLSDSLLLRHQLARAGRGEGGFQTVAVRKQRKEGGGGKSMDDLIGLTGPEIGLKTGPRIHHRETMQFKSNRSLWKKKS